MLSQPKVSPKFPTLRSAFLFQRCLPHEFPQRLNLQLVDLPPIAPSNCLPVIYLQLPAPKLDATSRKHTDKMGYLEDEVKRLNTVLGSVEGRLKALEERQFGKSSGKTAEEIRMILIGPPGAGKLALVLFWLHFSGFGIDIN